MAESSFPAEEASEGLSAVSLRAQAAQVLQSRLIRGYYLPGQRLSEAGIAEELAISRGPLREALQQLGSMGLVRHTTNRGWHVPKFTTAEIGQLYELREAFEGMAGRLAAQRRTADDIAVLRRILEEAQSALGKQGEGYPQGIDTDLHGTVLSIARNPMLAQRAQETQRQLALARHRSAASSDRAAIAFVEHQQIVEAIALAQPATAQRLLAAHIRNGARHALA